MLNIFRLSIVSLLLSGIGITSYAQEFRGAFHIEQKAFREENDSLYIHFQIQVDSRAVPSCAAMIFEPEVWDDNQNHAAFPYIQITGEERTKLNRRWFALCSDEWLAQYQAPYILVNTNRYTGETLEYTFRVPYQNWMDNARLVLKQQIIDCAGETHLYTYTLAQQVDIATREPYQIQPLVTLTTPKEESKKRSRQGSAYLDFQVNRSVILPDFRRNPVELGKINDALLDVMGDADATITGLYIEGYASPEGAYSSNERLARERATALKDYIRNHYMFSEGIFNVRSVAEDWDGLKSRVESSNIAQREQVLAIINSSDDPDTKERRLKGLNVYATLLRDIFPELRRVEYQIDYAVRSFSNTEARTLITSNPENLSQLELYRVAESYGKESAEYRRIIMETIPKYYENDPIALSNAAALLIENGEHNTALRLLEKARDLPAAWNNLAAVHLLRGELQQAEELLNRAVLAGVKEAAHNQAELAKKREDEAKRRR